MKLQLDDIIIELSVIPGPDDEYGLIDIKKNYYDDEIIKKESITGKFKYIMELYLEKKSDYMALGFSQQDPNIQFYGGYTTTPYYIGVSGTGTLTVNNIPATYYTDSTASAGTYDLTGTLTINSNP